MMDGSVSFDELSPSKVDIDLNDTSLSFLSCKDDDSVLLPDSLNSEGGCSQIEADLLKSTIMDSSHDIFGINSLSSEEPSEGLINALAEGADDFSMTEESVMNPITTVQATVPQNFLTASPSKTVDWVNAKVVSAANKGQPQLLILQKSQPGAKTSSASNVISFQNIQAGSKPSLAPKIAPASSSSIITSSASNVIDIQALLAGMKSVSGGAGSNVAVVQTSTGGVGNTKYVTIPSLNTSGNILSLNTSGSGNSSANVKSNDVKILLSGIQTSSPAYVAAKPANPLQVPLKRAVTPSPSGQMVTKVIITNNTASNASVVSSVPVSATTTNTSASGQPQSILVASPNKTYTLSRNNIFNLNNSHQMLKPILGTPAKQYVLSPVRPLQKPGFTSANYARSPRRIAPATNISVSQISTLNTGTKLATIIPSSMSDAGPRKISVSQSPTKVILKPVSQTLLKPAMSSSSTSSPSTITISTAGSTGISQSSPQSIQVPGSKFHYVRLVSAPSTSTTTTAGRRETTILPMKSSTSHGTNIITLSTTSVSSSISQIRPAVPIAPTKVVRVVAPKQATPKFLMPSVSGSQIRGATTVSNSQLGQLQGGTFIPVQGGNSSYVMLPAQYVQLQQPPSTQSSSGTTQMLNILPAPAPTPAQPTPSQSAFISIASNPPNNFKAAAHQHVHQSPRRSTPVETDNRQRKPCNCTKSQCLKLYCDCFANGEFCNNCNCTNCSNNLAREEERQKAIKACLDRNPLAFHPKIGKSREGNDHRRHTKGCNCKRSYCLKNYCECYEAKILCTSICKCIGCKNFEDSSERKTLMHLADAAEVRVQQQAAAKTNFSSDIFDFPTKPPVLTRSGERLPFAFVTNDVLEATCLCLLAHASEAEKSHSQEEEIERLVLEEFGRCLVRIIDCANQTKVSKMDMQ